MKSNSKKEPPQDGETQVSRPPLRQSENARALNSLARILTRREHSIAELKIKLQKYYSTDAVEYALKQAESQHWIRPPTEIAENAAEVYGRKLKSHTYIKHQMEKRGLPTPDLDFAKEQDKINTLIKRRFGKADLSDGQQRMKVLRFLRYRGFDLRSIKAVIKDTDVEVDLEES